MINIGSVAARVSPPALHIYSGTKGALNTMSQGWARELGSKGITVNTVAPGPVVTDYVLPEEHPTTKYFRTTQHIKRDGTAEEVASVALFVASPQSTFVTGQVLGVDGGINYN